MMTEASPEKARSPEEQEALRRKYYEMLDRQLARESFVPRGEAKTNPDYGIGPTPEYMDKAGPDGFKREVAEEHKRTFQRYRSLSEFEQLAILGARYPKQGITADQYAAGNRYHEDAYLAGIEGIASLDMERERVDGGQHKSIPEQVLEAATRYAKAIKALDRVQVSILAHVILKRDALDAFVDLNEFPQKRERRAIVLHPLRRALNRLIAHYNATDGIRPRKPKIEVMHEPGYRPNIIKGGAADDR